MEKEELKAVTPVSSSSQISADEVAQDLKKRLSLIDKEFKEGLTFIKKFRKSVTVFGSSMVREDDQYYQKAKQIGSLIAKTGYTVVTGGGPGIMEAANRGAKEAGGSSVGLNIFLPQEQKENDYLTDSYEFYYFFSRKMALTFAAEAYLFFPGGYGTLNEFFEIVTLIQTKKMIAVPVILVGKDFWEGMDSFIKDYLSQKRLIGKGAESIYSIIDDEKEIVDRILKTPVIETVPFPSL